MSPTPRTEVLEMVPLRVLTVDGFEYPAAGIAGPRVLEDTWARVVKDGYLIVSYTDRTEGHGPDGEHGVISRPMRTLIPATAIAVIATQAAPDSFETTPETVQARPKKRGRR